MKTRLHLWEYFLIRRFQQGMKRRMEMGRTKYGMDYLTKDNLTEAQAELLDLANYAMFEWIKLERVKNKSRKLVRGNMGVLDAK